MVNPVLQPRLLIDWEIFHSFVSLIIRFCTATPLVIPTSVGMVEVVVQGQFSKVLLVFRCHLAMFSKRWAGVARKALSKP